MDERLELSADYQLLEPKRKKNVLDRAQSRAITQIVSFKVI